MVTRYSMSDKLGRIALEKEISGSYPSPDAFAAGGRERNCGEETADEIDAEMRKTADTAFKPTVTLLTERRALLLRATSAPE